MHPFPSLRLPRRSLLAVTASAAIQDLMDCHVAALLAMTRCWCFQDFNVHQAETKNSIMTPEQKRANLKTGLILGSIAVVFFLGFMVKMYMLSRP